VVEGRSREVLDQVKSLVKEDMSCTPRVIVLTIVLTSSKTFLSEHLLNKDGEGPVEFFKGDKLCQMMDKFIMVSSPNI
jgi:hypothetical protein